VSNAEKCSTMVTEEGPSGHGQIVPSIARKMLLVTRCGSRVGDGTPNVRRRRLFISGVHMNSSTPNVRRRRLFISGVHEGVRYAFRPVPVIASFA
jgi:hypothetical protein